MYIAIALAVAAAISCGIIFGCRRAQKSSRCISDKIIKAVAYTYIVVCLWRKFMPDGFVFVNATNTDAPILSKDNFNAILRWGLTVCTAVNVVALLCDNKFFKNVSVAICLPFALLSIVFIDKFFAYFTGVVDSHWNNVRIPHAIQYAQFFLELGLGVAIPLALIFVQKLGLPTKKDIWHFFAGLIPVLLFSLNMFVPRALFGVTNLHVSKNAVGTAIWIISFVAAGFIGYFVFRFKNADTRYSVVLFVATELVMFFADKGVLGPSLSRISLFQFCNFANYLLFVAILFRIKFLFEYMLFANTLGAIIAFCFPDVGNGLFNPWDLHFLVDHAMLMVFPAMTLGLRIFPRPGKYSLLNTLFCFTIYFVFCFVCGTIINGIYDNNLLSEKSVNFLSGIGMWSRANFFYLFDHNRILQAAPFLSFVYSWRLPLGPFEMYPIWIVFFHTLFSGVISLIYLAMIGFVKLGDRHFAWRARRIASYEQRTGKRSKRKAQYED